jgi:hypothetical protein
VVVLIIIALYQVLCMLQLILDLHLELIVIHELLVHELLVHCVHLRMHLFRWIKWNEVRWAIVIPFFLPCMVERQAVASQHICLRCWMTPSPIF